MSLSEAPTYGAPFRGALFAILCLCVVVFGWGAAARLDSAVIAYGALIAESERKSVEHLEGGILRRLRVTEGERVRAGQALAELDASQSDAVLERLEAEAWSLRFDRWRLEAEERGADALADIDMPAAPPAVAAALAAAQRQLFGARSGAHRGALDALDREIDRLHADRRSADARTEAAGRTLALLAEERAAIRSLVDKGSAPRLRLIEFDRSLSEVEGDLGENRGRAAAAEAGIARARAERDRIEQERLSEIGEQLSETRRALSEIQAGLAAAEDVRRRLVLRAPTDGVVVDISVTSPGAVLAPGEPLLEILPEGDRLVAEVRLPPDAIDTVYPGRLADVILTAYKRADAPRIEAAVSFVSPDMLIDERDGSGYFAARVALPENALADAPDATLSAGMPVEVVIRTGERRAIDYFIEPFLRGARRALREE